MLYHILWMTRISCLFVNCYSLFILHVSLDLVGLRAEE